jgi:hypothetical protein
MQGFFQAVAKQILQLWRVTPADLAELVEGDGCPMIKQFCDGQRRPTTATIEEPIDAAFTAPMLLYRVHPFATISKLFYSLLLFWSGAHCTGLALIVQAFVN